MLIIANESNLKIHSHRSFNIGDRSAVVIALLTFIIQKRKKWLFFIQSRLH